MAKLPATRRGQLALVLGTVLASIGGGVVAGHNLFAPSAAVRATSRAQTLSDRNGTLQGLVHTGPIKKGHPFVPFLGPFSIHKHAHWHQCGPAVRLLEGALKRKGLRHTPPRNCVGKATVSQIKALQRSFHYKPTGVYNLVTHRRLVFANGYTTRARRDLLYLAHKEIVLRERHNVQVIAAHVALVGGSTLAYCQSGERSYFPTWPRIPPCTDCSGMVIFVLAQAGAGKSVNYFGPGSSVGWTGTLAYEGRSLRPGDPIEPGDVVLYPSSSARGPPWGHAAIAIGRGLVLSHGSVGVATLPYNYRTVGDIRRMIL